jgi:Beta-fructosidases (levanase/invertase)
LVKKYGQHGGVWECPDLFPIKVDGTEDLKWALIVSINPAAPNGGSGTQYFIGDFDGSKFTLDPNFKTQLQDNNAVWLDYGRDNYAGVTWSNIPKKDGRHLFIGWMSNWQYARDVPTETWRSAMTAARELKLVKNKERYVLSSLPVSEFSNYVSKTVKKDSLIVAKKQTIISNKDIDLSRLKLTVNLKDITKHKTTFLLHNSEGDSLSFGIDANKKTIF